MAWLNPGPVGSIPTRPRQHPDEEAESTLRCCGPRWRRSSHAGVAQPPRPLGTRLRVTNVANGRTVEVRVVDRLPPARTDRARRTVVDVSKGAAELLDFVRAGRVPVRVEVLEWGSGG